MPRLLARRREGAGCRRALETINLRDAAHLFDAGDIDASETLVRKALAINPKDAEALRLLGHCEYEHGRSWEALRLLNHPVHMRQQRLVGRNTKRYRCLEPMKVSAARLCRKKASGIKSAVLD